MMSSSSSSPTGRGAGGPDTASGGPAAPALPPLVLQLLPCASVAEAQHSRVECVPLPQAETEMDLTTLKTSALAALGLPLSVLAGTPAGASHGSGGKEEGKMEMGSSEPADAMDGAVRIYDSDGRMLGTAAGAGEEGEAVMVHAGQVLTVAVGMRRLDNGNRNSEGEGEREHERERRVAASIAGPRGAETAAAPAAAGCSEMQVAEMLRECDGEVERAVEWGRSEIGRHALAMQRSLQRTEGVLISLQEASYFVGKLLKYDAMVDLSADGGALQTASSLKQVVKMKRGLSLLDHPLSIGICYEILRKKRYDVRAATKFLFNKGGMDVMQSIESDQAKKRPRLMGLTRPAVDAVEGAGTEAEAGVAKKTGEASAVTATTAAHVADGEDGFVMVQLGQSTVQQQPSAAAAVAAASVTEAASTSMATATTQKEPEPSAAAESSEEEDDQEAEEKKAEHDSEEDEYEDEDEDGDGDFLDPGDAVTNGSTDDCLELVDTIVELGGPRLKIDMARQALVHEAGKNTVSDAVQWLTGQNGLEAVLVADALTNMGFECDTHRAMVSVQCVLAAAASASTGGASGLDRDTVVARAVERTLNAGSEAEAAHKAIEASTTADAVAAAAVAAGAAIAGTDTATAATTATTAATTATGGTGRVEPLSEADFNSALFDAAQAKLIDFGMNTLNTNELVSAITVWRELNDIVPTSRVSVPILLLDRIMSFLLEQNGMALGQIHCQLIALNCVIDAPRIRDTYAHYGSVERSVEQLSTMASARRDAVAAGVMTPAGSVVGARPPVHPATGGRGADAATGGFRFAPGSGSAFGGTTPGRGHGRRIVRVTGTGSAGLGPDSGLIRGRKATLAQATALLDTLRGLGFESPDLTEVVAGAALRYCQHDHARAMEFLLDDGTAVLRTLGVTATGSMLSDHCIVEDAGLHQMVGFNPDAGTFHPGPGTILSAPAVADPAPAFAAADGSMLTADAAPLTATTESGPVVTTTTPATLVTTRAVAATDSSGSGSGSASEIVAATVATDTDLAGAAAQATAAPTTVAATAVASSASDGTGKEEEEEHDDDAALAAATAASLRGEAMPQEGPTLSRSVSDPEAAVHLLEVVTGKPEAECRVALEAADLDGVAALRILEGGDLEQAPTQEMRVLMQATGRTRAEVASAIEFCNDDLEQAQMLLREQPTELGAYNLLNDKQRAALRYVCTSTRRQSEEATPELRHRVATLGYEEAGTLDAVLAYVRDRAPLCIHFKCDTNMLTSLLNDTHYRNLFEVGTSNGSTDKSARSGWEANCFSGAYDGADGSERPKYGVLNVVQDPNGVAACHSYGKSFFTLKDCRLRTTFASGDTSGSGVRLATPQYFAHVLTTFSDDELRAVVEVAIGLRPHGSESRVISNYKEIQVHGEIRLDRHIEAAYVTPEDFAAQSELLERFSARHGIPIIPMESTGTGGDSSAASGGRGFGDDGADY